MNIIKEIAKNYLIKIPLVAKLSAKRGLTGVNSNPDEVKMIFEKYNEIVDLRGKEIIELGTGHTFDILSKAKDAGAKKVCAVDIQKYVEEISPDITFRLYDGSVIPFANEKFDITWSWTVYEHIRFPITTVKETNRILKNGGISINYIDLVDHFAYTDYHVVDNSIVFNCLKYSKWLWNLMTWNRGMYVNRLRYSQWLEIFKENGFEIIHVERTNNKYVENNYKNISYLKNLEPEDASTMQVLIVCKKTQL